MPSSVVRNSVSLSLSVVKLDVEGDGGEKERRREKKEWVGVDVMWTLWVRMCRRVEVEGRWVGRDWSS